VTELHARMTLYAGSLAPASFVREYVARERTTWVTRTRGPRGWAVRDVTEQWNDDTQEIEDADRRPR
ncbi:MAG TPA: hypothetical protein VFG69_05715, partial [Nannocystaceae bacterium]|nr:hypothetical protein [Nannocystaceae bacterium]